MAPNEVVLLDRGFDDLEITCPDPGFWRKRAHKAKRKEINRMNYAKHHAKKGSRARRAIEEQEAEDLAACGDFPTEETGK